MLEAAEKAVGFAEGSSRDDLERDEKLALAVVRLIEILGEASSGVSQPFQSSHPEIPWRAMKSTRNRLIHGYFDVDIDVV